TLFVWRRGGGGEMFPDHTRLTPSKSAGLAVVISAMQLRQGLGEPRKWHIGEIRPHIVALIAERAVIMARPLHIRDRRVGDGHVAHSSGTPALRMPSKRRSVCFQTVGLSPCARIRKPRKRAMVNSGWIARPALAAARASSSRPRWAKAAAR